MPSLKKHLIAHLGHPKWHHLFERKRYDLLATLYFISADQFYTVVQILRIEDPNTHEALDLKEITSKTRTKEATLNEARLDVPGTNQHKEATVAEEKNKDLSSGDGSEKVPESVVEQEVKSSANADSVHEVR